MTLDGTAVPVTGLRKLPSAAGLGETLAWQVSLPAAASTGDHLVKVTIAGVKIDGALQGVDYAVNTFDPSTSATRAAVPLTLTNPVVQLPKANKASRSRIICQSKVKQVAKAKRALQKASKKKRKAAVRKAKKNLKAKKRARTLACT
ncbi:MAG: hypothetical protein ACSLFD_00575 [Solirubrobacterales bacterium]